MSLSRMVLVNLLEKKLNRDPKVKEDILQRSQIHWAKVDAGGSLCSRAFDILQFVPLVPPDRFKTWLAGFMELLTIYAIHKTDEGFFLANEADRTRVKAWAMRIVEYSCENFLEAGGMPNKKLMHLLKWDDYAAGFIHTPAQIKSIARSLTGIIYQQVTYNKKTESFITMDIHMALIAYINKNYGDWVNKEIDEKYPVLVDDSAKVEVKAAAVIRKLLGAPVDFVKLDKMYEELAHTEKLDRNQQRILWLEIMMQSASYEELFVGLWRVFSHHINPARDVPLLSDHQRDQYDICRRRFLNLKELATPSTSRMLDRLSPIAKEVKKEPQPPRLPLAMPVEVVSKKTIEMVPVVGPEEKGEEADEDYFLVPLDTPNHFFISQGPSLVDRLAQGVSDHLSYFAGAVKMRFR